jgi:hypothetical protein
MKLLGVSSVRDLNRSYIDVPSGWLRSNAGNENLGSRNSNVQTPV